MYDNCPRANWYRPETCTRRELKTSPAFNEALLKANFQEGLNVRLDGLDGSHMGWGLGDPVGSQGWESSQIAMITRLMPHIRQFVRVRQALVRAKAIETTETALLENRRIGVVHLDRLGRIMAANDRARRILRHGDRLWDRGGVLRTRGPDEQTHLDRLVAAALPTAGTIGVSGSMPVRPSSGLPPLMVYVKPVKVLQPDFGARHAAVLVLLVEPGHRPRIDPNVVAAALGLAPKESQVAAWLAEGKTVEHMARSTGHTKNAIYWHLKQIYQKLHISRQADLVRLVLSLTQWS